MGYLTNMPGTRAQQPAAGQQQAAQNQGMLPPGQYSKIALAPDQGEPIHWSADDLRKAHAELSAKAGAGQPANARDLMRSMVTRTHSMILVHRPQRQASQAGGAEVHEGVTDFYTIVGGSGTIIVGGEVENRRMSRPGEYGGGPIKGGREFKVKVGDMVNIPPGMAHAAVPDAGGMTYTLMKINIGLYPWWLINGTP
jgi:mannose-6-phosphate isomerase-like protein (cupin superfamily)